ncbi:MAG: hypothetical protein AMJ90_04230 [candidate division Zixibacteria bacterium SM23_73_2]|nr:MAG: hypothetical protein AMJ90_04230 [candidate division Zixibacteria bacterium SM23_73_2]
MDNEVKLLLKKEKQAIVETMAFMAYNPSIGRVMQKDGVTLFQDMASKNVKKLSNIISASEFDKFHKNWMKNFISKIKRNKGLVCSYGQAQKAINVFLKLYVDWAKLPKRSISRKIRSYLHVPIDKILMKEIIKKYPNFYQKTIKQYKKGNYNHSLSKIGEEEYYKWQCLFRSQFPTKPLIFDVIWALNRKSGG